MDMKPEWYNSKHAYAEDQSKALVAKCFVSDKKIEKVSFLPVLINKQAQPRFVTRQDKNFDEIVNYIIKIAKEQGLSLEPAKISGVCGRLLCCLGYESELYRSMRELLPPVGQRVVTPLGEGSVSGTNPIKGTVMVQLESQVTVELPVSEVNKKESGAEEKKQGHRRSLNL